jgi:hypothetical protein
MKHLLISLIVAQPAYAYEVIKLREMYLTHKLFKYGSRNFDYDNAELKDREIGQELTLNFNLDILSKHMFWDNEVISYVDRWKESHFAGYSGNSLSEYSRGIGSVSDIITILNIC